MATITVNVTDDIEHKFREEVKEHIGSGKGTLGKAVTEAMALWIEKKTQQDIASELRQSLDRGYQMGKIRYNKRTELYARK